MADPIWYFGPDWDMRPLVCPEKDITMPVVRYGGIFQGLSGARTVRVTGHKQEFKFDLRYLDPDEYKWLEACHLRAIPGPFRLINPMKKNLLSYNGSMLKIFSGFDTSGQGIVINGGSITAAVDWPSIAPALGNISANWNPGGGHYARIDSKHMFPVTPGVPVTISVYTKGTAPSDDAWLLFDWYDKKLASISTISTGAVVIGNTWQRFSFTRTPPAGAYTARMGLYSSESTSIYLAAAQAEVGSTATTWEMGGAAPRVVLDSLDMQSPRYPYLNTTLSLLEA